MTPALRELVLAVKLMSRDTRSNFGTEGSVNSGAALFDRLSRFTCFVICPEEELEGTIELLDRDEGPWQDVLESKGKAIGMYPSEGDRVYARI